MIWNAIMEKEEIENGHPCTKGITRKDPPHIILFAKSMSEKEYWKLQEIKKCHFSKAKPATIRPDLLKQMLKVRRTWTKVFLATKQTIFLPGLLNLVAIL